MKVNNDNIEKRYYIVYPLPNYVDIGEWKMFHLIGYTKSVGVAKMYYNQIVSSSDKYKNIINIVDVTAHNLTELSSKANEILGIDLTEGDELGVYKLINGDSFTMTMDSYSECISEAYDTCLSINGLHPVVSALRQLFIIMRFMTNGRDELISLLTLLYRYYMVRIILSSNVMLEDLSEYTRELFKLSITDGPIDLICMDTILYRDHIKDIFSNMTVNEELPFK